MSEMGELLPNMVAVYGLIAIFTLAGLFFAWLDIKLTNVYILFSALVWPILFAVLGVKYIERNWVGEQAILKRRIKIAKHKQEVIKLRIVAEKEEAKARKDFEAYITASIDELPQ